MSKQITRQPKVDRRRDRREEQRKREEERRRAARRTRYITIGTILALVLVVGGVIFFATHQPASVPTSTPGHPTVDASITCDAQEQLAFHIHSHLSIYVNGASVPVPAQVGIPSDNSCFYWLHTHDTSGVIHMEAPVTRSFTLGNFLDIWNDQEFRALGFPTQLALPSSDWKIYVDGTLYTGDFHDIVLKSHTLVTLAYDSPDIHPDTPKSYQWTSDLPQ